MAGAFVAGGAYTRGMAGRDDVERVRRSVNLAELFEAVTTVRRSGASWQAVCPFHAEKTPSLSIDPGRGLFHCFGCGRGGDVFTFLELTQGLEFREALQELADRAGITLSGPSGSDRTREKRRRLLDAVEEAGRFYHETFLRAKEAAAARDYVRGRGYDREVVERFQLGFAPSGWDVLSRRLHERGFAERVILEAGLAKRNREGRLYDHIRGRLIFPIRNVSGALVGFGGRALGDEQPKYLNTPETPLYKKSDLLYGLDLARAGISRSGRAVVVEGYTDVIAFHQAEYPAAVATCGTALGKSHLELLGRFASTIVLAFDADAAGERAAVRGDELRISSNLDLDLRVAIMPPGRDPADLVRSENGPGRLREIVETSELMIEFHLKAVLNRFDMKDASSRARAVGEAAPLIALRPNEVERDEHARFVARHTGTEVAAVKREINRARGSGRPPSSPPAAEVPRPERERAADSAPASEKEKIEPAQEGVIRHLLAGTAPAEQVELDLFTGRGVEVASWLLEEARRLPPGTPLPLAGGKFPELEEELRPLALLDKPLDPIEDLLSYLAEKRRGRRKEELRRKLLAAERNKDAEEVSRITGELLKL